MDLINGRKYTENTKQKFKINIVYFSWVTKSQTVLLIFSLTIDWISIVVFRLLYLGNVNKLFLIFIVLLSNELMSYILQLKV